MATFVLPRDRHGEPDLILSIRLFHEKLSKLSAELKLNFNASEHEISIQGKRNQHKNKRVILLPIDAKDIVKNAVSEIDELHETIMQTFEMTVLRSINKPQVFHDVGYASLSISKATSVQNMNETGNESREYFIQKLTSYINFTNDKAEKKTLGEELKKLENLDLNTVRLVKPSGASYQLHIFDDDDKKISRCNVNHATILISSNDNLPNLLPPRKRRTRSDVKDRKLAVDFDGRKIIFEDGRDSMEWPPVKIYYA